MNNTTIIAWMEQIDRRLQSIEKRLVTRNEHQTLQDRLSRVESKTHKLALKVGGISSVIGFVVFIASKVL